MPEKVEIKRSVKVKVKGVAGVIDASLGQGLGVAAGDGGSV